MASIPGLNVPSFGGKVSGFKPGFSSGVTSLKPGFSAGVKGLAPNFGGNVPFGLGKIRFVPNPVGIAALKVNPLMLLMLAERVEEAAEAAKAAWVASGPHPFEVGDYGEAFEGGSIVRGATAVGIVTNHDFKANWIEYGTQTGNLQAFAPLRKGAEASGLKVVGEKGGATV